jgi:Zn-finger nucleic acid-binding protein
MDCPKCVGNLSKKTMENIEVDVCFVCEGIWFDATELEEVIKRDSHDFKFLDIGREEFDGREVAEFKKEFDTKTGKCPRCNDGTALVRKEYEGKHIVNVDICPKGHGVWFDGGEIKELRKRGLVDIKDQLDFHLEFLRYIFSKDGFRDFMHRKSRSANK